MILFLSSFFKFLKQPLVLVSTCERVDTFFSPTMWHHAGRPTTGHWMETIGINITSPQETDHYTLSTHK